MRKAPLMGRRTFGALPSGGAVTSKPPNPFGVLASFGSCNLSAPKLECRWARWTRWISATGLDMVDIALHPL
eukprot:6150254-Prorocentrum_lima.AAC.1